ncbi:MAG: hypothetical protein D6826_07840, partial [Alphaproteobacteria bacterium]
MKRTGVIIVFAAWVALGLSAPTQADIIFETTSGKGLTPNGTAFTNSLYEGYVALSDDRVAATDLVDAEHFNLKARRAGQRSDVLPDEVSERKLRDEDAAELSAALNRLRRAFERGGRSRAPVKAAEAQVSYDCWIEAAEGANPAVGFSSAAAARVDDVARCKAAF